ncbi:MAG: sulfotransferase family 2 domain-containing protein [Bacteroidota bacterium]
MIISHKHKFIFVKTRKTAGTSLEIALSKICGKDDIITPISEDDEQSRRSFANISAQNFRMPMSQYTREDYAKLFFRGKPKSFYNHMTCAEIKANVPKEVWDSYYKFTIERNPFDKVVSLYYYRGADKKFASIYDFLKNGGLKGFNSFDIYAIDGVVAVDHIYRYEDIRDLCPTLTQDLKLDSELTMPEKKAKSSTRKVKNYKDLLDEKSIELIKLIFAREIKLFGYAY